MSWTQIATNFNLNINHYVKPILIKKHNCIIYHFKTNNHSLYIQLMLQGDDIFVDVLLQPYIKYHKNRVYKGYLSEQWLLLLIYQLLNQYFKND